jgi:hypothetical protein
MKELVKPNKFKDLTIVPCGTCTREIIKEQEKDGELFIKNGKPMCMVCRATKLSVHRSEIEQSAGRMRADIKEVNDKFDQEEFEKVVHVAAQAQEQVEKSLKA